MPFDPTRAFADAGQPVAATAWPEELQRRASARDRVLRRLQSGPATNIQLAGICQRFGGRIHELRTEWEIDKQPVSAGVWRYSLIGKKTGRLF